MMGPQWQFRPARDHGLTPPERLRSAVREPGLGSVLLGSAWRGLVRAYLRIVHDLRVTGREHLPAPPFVVVGNHCSHLDALSVAAALPARLARRAYAMAAGDTFFTSVPGAAFAAYAINALPVWRGATTEADIDAWRARLVEDGAVLILFPEGTRSRTGAMGRFRPGIGTLVAGTSVPVVPCHIAGAFAAWPPNRRWPRPGKLRLRFGPALHFADSPPGREGALAVAAACEAAVRGLAPPVTPP